MSIKKIKKHLLILSQELNVSKKLEYKLNN